MAVFERFDHQGVEGIRTGKMNHVTGSFVNYRIGDTLIDCGPSGQWQHLKPFFEEQPVRQVLITHYHEDHSGNSCNFNDHFNVLPSAHEHTRLMLARGFKLALPSRYFWGGVPQAVTQPIPDKIHLQDGAEVIPIHVPGHSVDMQCYFVPDRGWMFTGDLYIAKVIKFMHIKEDMPQQVEDIRRVLACDFETIFCPHRGVVENGKQAMQDKLDYILDLCGNAQKLHQQGKPVKVIARELLGKEEMAGYFTLFHFSKRSLIQGCLQVDLT